MEQMTGVVGSAAAWLGPYMPRWLGALAIVAAAWIAGRLARAATQRLVAARQVEQKLQTPGLGQTLGGIAHAVVWLLALPALLDALGLQGLLAPVNAVLIRLLGVLPGVVGAAVVFGVGLLAARILRQLVTGVLKAAGSESLASRAGVGAALGENGLAGLAGSVVFVLVMLPTATAALQALGLDVLAKPVANLLDQVIDLIPKLVTAAIIVALFVLLGRMLSGLVTALMAGLGANSWPAKLGLAAQLRIGGREPAELAGSIVMAAALFLGLTQGLEVLGLKVLSEALVAVGGSLADALAAFVVLGAGLWAAGVASRSVAATSIVHAALLGRIAYAAIVTFAVALALRKAGLPADIIAIAFGAAVGAVALAAAIALGFGGRGVAARLLESAADSFTTEKSGNERSGR
jgi:hypothetical protein